MTVLRTPDDRFANLPDFDFDAHYLPVHDPSLGELRMHYVGEGDPGAATVLVLHGEPACHSCSGARSRCWRTQGCG